MHDRPTSKWPKEAMLESLRSRTIDFRQPSWFLTKNLKLRMILMLKLMVFARNWKRVKISNKKEPKITWHSRVRFPNLRVRYRSFRAKSSRLNLRLNLSTCPSERKMTRLIKVKKWEAISRKILKIWIRIFKIKKKNFTQLKENCMKQFKNWRKPTRNWRKLTRSCKRQTRSWRKLINK